MKTTIGVFALVLVVSFAALGQQAAPSRPDALLDHMTGAWTLQGTLAGHETTHDVEADWVLNHEYVRLHESSREKNPQGQPAYEAIVFLAWDEPTSEYKCMWLDSTSGGGLSAQGIAHGKRSGDEIAFLFKGADGSNFYTTFLLRHQRGHVAVGYGWRRPREAGTLRACETHQKIGVEIFRNRAPRFYEGPLPRRARWVIIPAPKFPFAPLHP